MAEFKQGVHPDGLTIACRYAVLVMDHVYGRRNLTLVVKSTTEGYHGEESSHYLGTAFDCETSPGIQQSEAEKIGQEARRRLSNMEFDVVVEDDHIHIEHDPKEEKEIFE